MADILYLVHRIPYPPNKGDKVRSYHLLMHLVNQGHRVFLGTFIDDPEDQAHVAVLSQWCADVHAVTIEPRTRKLMSLKGLVNGNALTLEYYRDAGLSDWVDRTAQAHRLDAAVVFSSSMAPYALGLKDVTVLSDLVDVDSAKWQEYAGQHKWPMSWLYRREASKLLDYETEVVQASDHGFLVTEAEVELLAKLSPATRGKVSALGNGVNAEYFNPDATLALPDSMRGQGPRLVFTGAMDYWPNVDAVGWFVREVMPALRERLPGVGLHIVGRSPAPAVEKLAGDDVVVTGTVPDVRPYLQHADVVVAPLRLARGVQNKVLEAMAMGRPVVAARSCVDAIDAEHGEHLFGADAESDYVRHIVALATDAAFADRIGQAGRDCVLQRYSWAARLAELDRHLKPRARDAQAGHEVGEVVSREVGAV